MQFPFGDDGDDGVCSFEDNRLDMNVTESWAFERSISCAAVEATVVRSMRRVMSEDQLESATSVADTFNSPSRSSSSGSYSSLSRCDSGSWLRVNDEGRTEDVLPEWPAVDDDLVASGKRHLLTFDLDPTTLPTDVLCHLAMEMFVSAGLPAGLAEDRVQRFILAVRASMLDNPYHNFYHVVDVMQTTNALATSTGIMARLDAWERFGMLSAALCHDLEHPGVTSAFLSKAGDSRHGGYKNIVFKDALLEKHHALRALGVMVERDIGILEGLSSEEYYHFRSSVQRIILATDISRHNEYLGELQEFAARRAEDPAVEMDKQLAMEMMVKCADISNVVKPAVVARRWALRITDEFFGQGDAERAMGIEVSQNCDRLAQSRVSLQTGFIDYLAGPLFTLLAATFPGLDTPMAQLQANRASYALCTDVDLEGARDWKEREVATCSSSSSDASLRSEALGWSGVHLNLLHADALG